MPTKKTTQRARKAAKQGKAPTTQAGPFVREEMEHVREGRHGASSRKQVVAIGLSKARRSGVKVGPPKKGKTTKQTREKAERDLRAGQSGRKKTASKGAASRKSAPRKKGAAARKKTSAGRSSSRSRR
jgi:hypothetical protein